jgi:hypothetical protein
MNTNERIEHHEGMIEILRDINYRQAIIEIEKDAIIQFGNHFPEFKRRHQEKIDLHNSVINSLEKTYKDLKAKL